MNGAELIVEERQRQIAEEGWLPEHDDEHKHSELAKAGAAYALEVTGERIYARIIWPWDKRYWKPTPENKIKQLVKAGALIAAEIDRLDRQRFKRLCEKAEAAPPGGFLNP